MILCVSSVCQGSWVGPTNWVTATVASHLVCAHMCMLPPPQESWRAQLVCLVLSAACCCCATAAVLTEGSEQSDAALRWLMIQRQLMLSTLGPTHPIRPDIRTQQPDGGHKQNTASLLAQAVACAGAKGQMIAISGEQKAYSMASHMALSRLARPRAKLWEGLAARPELLQLQELKRHALAARPKHSLSSNIQHNGASKMSQRQSITALCNPDVLPA